MSLEGKKAPAFTLTDQAGNKVRLAELAGQWVVLYCYPKDDTPGCTIEAQDFTKDLKKFGALGAAVFGCSPDSVESHQKFIAKYKLPFTLLCDPNRKIMEKYGAWGEKMMYGKKTVGVIRSTTWVGPDGKVKKHWKRVAKAADHPDKVLELLQEGAG